MKVLEVNNISVYYGDIQALWDVGFSVEEGQLVTILGTNGAGKTTTLKTIAGLLQPKSGKISFNGDVISGMPVHEVADAGISLVPEGRQLFPQLNVEDNLRMGSYLKRTKEKRDKNLKYVFELFPVLADRKNQEAQTLSGGEQQMLAIARALMSSPRLLLLDEPSLGLAPLIVEQIMAIIGQIREDGLTVLLVEQNANAALELGDYGYVIETGRVVLEDQSCELLNNPKVKEAYLG
jgi:branched-chain amino acid transport system ATP-binding protein